MKPRTQPKRLKDLPGWADALAGALCAQYRAPAGHLVNYTGPGPLRTVGNFIAPPSVDSVTTELVVCLAIGIGSFQNEKRDKLERKRQMSAQVIDLAEARRTLAYSRPEQRIKNLGYDPRDPKNWALHRAPYAIQTAVSVVVGKQPTSGGAS